MNKRKIFLISLAVITLMCLTYYLVRYQFNPYFKKGYRGKDFEIIETLNKENKELLLKYDKINNLSIFLSDERVDLKKLDNYFKMMQEENALMEDVINAVNAKSTLKDYLKYKNSVFKNDPYYLKSREDRYMSYALKNNYKLTNKDEIRKVVELVNSNRDKEVYQGEFKADLTKGNLVLVNKYYYLSKDYIPDDLVAFTYGMGSGYIRQEVFEEFKKMKAKALESGFDLISISPFRTYNSQYSLYNSYVLYDGEKNADRYSARAGYSEHQTGLVIDISIPGVSIDNFVETKAYQWMKENADKYGFIERYPLNKEEVTGYMHESWHYRYVGKEVATYIKESGLTFDEYYTYFVIKE